MSTKALFIFFRGIKLFGGYLKSNLISLLALSSLFIILHTAFSIGTGMAEFASSAARFDQIRVYPEGERVVKSVETQLNHLDEAESIKYYSAKDAKTYIQNNSQSVEGLDRLPEELFPVFFEITVKPEYRNVESLEKISSGIAAYDGVNKTSYGKEWAEQLAKGKNAVISLLAVVSILFALVGTVVIYQTVSISLYRYRKEVKVYGIVGGTRIFIVLPFVLVSLLMALSCSALSLAGYFLFRAVFLEPVERVLGLSMSVDMLYIWLFLAVAAAVSIAAGAVSTVLFTRRAQEADES